MSGLLAQNKARLSILALALAIAVLVPAALAGGVAWADDQQQSDVVVTIEDTPSEGEAQDGDGSNKEIELDSEKNLIKENQLPDSSFIYDTSIADLASADSYYDSQTVQVVGEAVGDIINEEIGGDYCWVTLWDKSETVTVYMSRVNAELIDTLGSYSRKGTTLQVRGTFNLTCSDHEGVSDLHATSVTVTERGTTKTESFDLSSFVPGILVLAAGLLLLFAFYRIRERQR